MDEELLKLLIRIYAYLKRTSPPNMPDNDSYAKTGNKSLGTILEIIENNHGISVSELIRESKMRQQSVSEIVSILEHRGLITKKQSPENARKSAIYITDDGIKIKDELSRQRKCIADAFFSCLSEEEKLSLVEIMRKLEENNR